ncbi:uncharacterized protein LOC143281381 [Babylonia areolata]|uniref:uncharacterized protein LOC143281381 n=1 Tax=Babylonia areolata TaxID=304850 RepID=UPI003FD5EFD1
MTVAATGLYAAGLITPYWLHIDPSGFNGSVHYGVFSICYTQPPECCSWDQHTKALENELWVDRYKSPGIWGITVVLLPINIIALLESDIILLWVLFKSPTRFWAQSAWRCTMSGLIFGGSGSAAFLVPQMNAETTTPTLGWSAMAALTAVGLELLANVCVRLVLWWQAVTAVDSSTDISVRVSSTSQQILQTPPATFQESRRLTRWSAAVQTSQSCIPDIISSQQAGPELLRRIELQRQRSIKHVPGTNSNQSIPSSSAQSSSKPSSVKHVVIKAESTTFNPPKTIGARGVDSLAEENNMLSSTNLDDQNNRQASQQPKPVLKHGSEQKGNVDGIKEPLSASKNRTE